MHQASDRDSSVFRTRCGRTPLRTAGDVARSMCADVDDQPLRGQAGTPNRATIASARCGDAATHDPHIRYRRYTAGQTIFQEGATAECLYTVTDGEVRLFKLLTDGRRRITGFLQPGAFLGLADRGGYVYGAEAIGVVHLAGIPLVELDRALDFRGRLLAAIWDELVAAQEQILLLGRKPARERVLAFLLARAARSTPENRSVAEFDLALSHSDIADYLGLTRETVCRVITALRAEGLVSLSAPRRVRFPDLQAAQVIADGT